MPVRYLAEIPVPKGLHDNSLAFQRWGDIIEFPSLEGTSEIDATNSIPRSTVPSGLAPLSSNPAFKRWAIIKCPSGTNSTPALNFQTTLRAGALHASTHFTHHASRIK